MPTKNLGMTHAQRRWQISHEHDYFSQWMECASTRLASAPSNLKIQDICPNAWYRELFWFGLLWWTWIWIMLNLNAFIIAASWLYAQIWRKVQSAQ